MENAAKRLLYTKPGLDLATSPNTTLGADLRPVITTAIIPSDIEKK